MKFKPSAIALAVAGTVATPMAAQAALYASARIGIENVETSNVTADEVSDLRVRSFDSRFGARGETDLGNGMTAFGRYEWDVDFTESDSDADASDGVEASDDDGITLRHRYVGLKGDFGSVTIGQTYHTFYNFIFGPTDNPWWGSGYAYLSPGRTDQGITYLGYVGSVNYSVTGYFQHDADEDSPDGTELAVSIPISGMTLGVGMRDREDFEVDNRDEIIGLALTGIAAGDASLGIGIQTQDGFGDSFVIDIGLGNAYIHYEWAELDDDAGGNEPNAFTLGYTQSLGRKTTAWYEYVDYDADGIDDDDPGDLGAGLEDDTTVIRAVLKYDIE